MKNTVYYRQAELLLRILPVVHTETDFALKGGTAINFFVRIQARSRLVSMIQCFLTPEERRFILSIKAGEPEWDLLGLKGIENLPAVKWKILNIKKMSPKKHKEAFDKLKFYLEA